MCSTAIKVLKPVHVYIYIFSATSISIIYKINLNNNEEEKKVEPQGQALAKRTCRGGQNEQTNKIFIGKERRAMQAGSGGHIGRVEKQLGLNLQVGGGRLKLYRDLGLLMSNGFHLKHAWCKV